MTAPDLATAARQLNALVERMQEVMRRRLVITPRIGQATLVITELFALLDGPEQRAAQGALKAALAEEEEKPVRWRWSADSHAPACDFARYGSCTCGLLVPR